MLNKLSKKRGVSLVEVVVGIAIIVSAVLSTFFYFSFATQAARKSTQAIQVASLLEEGMEALRIMRDDDWDNLATLNKGQDYYVVFEGGAWNATTTPQSVGAFERSFTLHDVYRDANDDITTSGGTLDPDTIMANVTVLWQSSPVVGQKGVSTYLGNVFDE